MELDESMDAFKALPTFVQRRRVTRRLKSHPKKKKKPVSSSSASVKDTSEPSRSAQSFNSSEKEQTEKILSQEDSQTDNADALFPCKTCGELFKPALFKAHSAVCLRVNFEACRLASGNLKNLRCRGRDKAENDEQNTLPPRSTDLREEIYFCPTCEMDLSSLTEVKRNTHANRCLDHLTPKKSPLKKSKQPKIIEKVPSKPIGEELRCQMCTKVLRSRAEYKIHLVRCQKTKGFSTMSVLALNRPENGDEIDVDLLAEIQRSEMRDQEPQTSTGKPVEKKVRAVKKRATKLGSKKERDYEEEMLKLALKVSKGEDLTKKVNKREKEVIPSVLSTVSPNSKREAQKSRIQEILEEQNISDEDDIPSTPALPPTSLRFSSINKNRAHRRLVSGSIDAEENSPSNEISNVEPLTRHNTDPQPQGVHDRLVHSPMQPPPVLAPPTINLTPSSSNNPVHPKSVLEPDDELQSPEVSSSNINNASTSYSSDNTANNNRPLQQADDRESHCGQRRLQRPSKWTMTSESHDQDQKKYIVSGLLSQFEKRKVESVVVQPNLRRSPVKDSQKMLDPTLQRDEDPANQDIDCTLMNLEKLDEGTMNDFKECDNQDMDIENNVQPDSGDTTSSPYGENINSLVEADIQDPLSGFVKAIDNPLFSDGRIVLGRDKQVLHVHLIILYSRCPGLYKEVVQAEEKILFLPEYSKQLFLPFIRYVYSGKIGALSKTGLSRLDALSELHEIAKRFNTNLSQSLEIASCTKSLPHHSLLNEDVSSNLESNVSNDAGDADSDDSDAFLSQPNPSQRVAVEDHLKPLFSLHDVSNCTEEELNSDADLFEATEIKISSPQSLKDVSSQLPGKEEVDFLESLFDEQSTESDEKSVEQKLSVCHTNKQMCHTNENFAFTEMKESDDLSSENDRDKPKIKPKDKKREVKSKQLYQPIRRSRRSSSSGRRQHKRRSSCPCCETDSPHSKVLKLSSQKWKRSLKTHKLSPSPLALKNSNLTTPRKKSEVVNSKLKSLRVSGGKRVTGTQTPEKQSGFTPASKKRKCATEDSVPSQEKKKLTPGTKQNNSQSSSSHSDTIYVSERLPRLKQREHIRNRPAVANMGKSGIKSMKSIKKNSFDPLKSAKGPTKSKIKKNFHKRLSASQPLPSRGKTSDFEVKDEKKEGDDKVKRIHKIKKKLRTYIKTSEKRQQCDINSLTDTDDIIGSNSDCSSSDVTYDDLSNEMVTSLTTISPHKNTKQDVMCETQTPVTADNSRRTGNEFCTQPVPITPMPNFDDMDTPEVRRNASHYGIKKTLGKAKIKTKLKEAYMYTHQVVSEGEDSIQIDPPFDELDMDVFNITMASSVVSDASGGEEELIQFKHTLSRLSASPQINQKVLKNVYSFDCLTTNEVHALSTSVVDKMHTDKTLLEALHAMKKETGSIKRGSQKDKDRCWGMVTPGSSGYDPKINAILMLPEEYQSAITAPLVSCIVKNYIDYKKYMFDCLPVLCDRMEKEMGHKTLK